MFTGFFQVTEDGFPLLFNVFSGLFLFCPGFSGSGLRLILRNAEFFLKFSCKLPGKNGLTGKCQERIHETDAGFCEFLHVVLDIFRVGRYHRAVVMIACAWHLLALIRDAGVENKRYATLYEPGNVSVRQLGRVTFGFTGNRLNAQFIDLAVRLRRQHHAEAQLTKENGPVRIVFIHI